MKQILFSLVLLAHLSLFADTSEIESLERQRWQYIKSQNWKDLDAMIAPYFQASIFEGSRNKEQFMNRLKTINISDYTLDNFVITQGPGVAVATYDVTVSETISGKRISSKAGRLSVWQNANGKWLLIAHAILIPVPASSPN